MKFTHKRGKRYDRVKPSLKILTTYSSAKVVIMNISFADENAGYEPDNKAMYYCKFASLSLIWHKILLIIEVKLCL